LAFFAFLDVKILIQVDINTDISKAIETNTCVFHRVFIRNVGISIALGCFKVVLIVHKHT
jgi:hypothetical protein